jgi:hypothetical protein
MVSRAGRNKFLFFTNYLILNKTLLKNQCVIKEIEKGKIRKFLNSNENKNKTYQNLWNIERQS